MSEIKVKVIKFDVNWLEIKNLCRATVNMEDSKIEPNDEWKRKLLIAEHSPIRHSQITIEIQNVEYYAHTHIVRHSVGVTPYVGTSRSDRTNVDRRERRQTDPVNMRLDLNIQSLINISRKRLCNCADVTTQKVWYMVVREIAKYDKNIAWACVPEGIRTMGCPESFNNCNMCEKILEDMPKEELFNITKRYDHYKKFLEENRVKKLTRKK